jgi:hypothetical protein
MTSGNRQLDEAVITPITKAPITELLITGYTGQCALRLTLSQQPIIMRLDSRSAARIRDIEL